MRIGKRDDASAGPRRTRAQANSAQRSIACSMRCATPPLSDDAAAQARVRDAWAELTRVRVERLVGCLSTPVPKPGE